MARRKIDFRDNARKRIEAYATDAAIADDFKCERKVLFDEISYSTSEGSKKGTRLEAFVDAEKNRCLSGDDPAALQNVEAFTHIVDARLAARRLIAENPNGPQARRQRHQSAVQAGMHFAVTIALLVSKAIQAEYNADVDQSDHVPLLRPYYIPEKDWEKGRVRYNALKRRKGIFQDFDVGNKKPPKKTRFKVSGNPKGRKKKDMWSDLKASLDAPVKAKTKAGASVEVNRREQNFQALWRKAMDGNSASRRELMLRIKDLDRRSLLVAPPRARRLRKLKLNEEQELLLMKVARLTIDRTDRDMRVVYARQYGHRTAIANADVIVDYEYEEKCRREASGDHSNIEPSQEEGPKSASLKYPNIPTIKRKRSIPPSRSTATESRAVSRKKQSRKVDK